MDKSEVFIKIMIEFRDHIKDLKGPQVSVLLVIALHSNGKDSWPSLSTICDKTGYSRPAVCEALRDLEKGGWIKVKRTNRKVNHYALSTNLIGMGDISKAGQTSKPSLPDLVNSVNHPSQRSLLALVNEVNSKKKPIEEETNEEDTPYIPQGEKSEIYSPDFNAFWSVYPRPCYRKRAWKCWCTLINRKVDPQRLIKAAGNYARQCADKGTTEGYISHPATFLGPSDLWTEHETYTKEVSKDAGNSTKGFRGRKETASEQGYSRAIDKLFAQGAQ